MRIERIGIIGAGKLGVTLAQLALEAGYEVYIAGSGNPEKIMLSTQIVTPGATALATKEVVEKADIVVLALPLGQFRMLDPALFSGKLVLDAMNHWFEVDGPLEDIIMDDKPTTTEVQRHLIDARVVKALNHMGYHHLRDEAKTRGANDRKAIAFASDSQADVDTVAQFIDSIGFDQLYIGRLSASRPLESGGSAFGANVTSDVLKQLVGGTR